MAENNETKSEEDIESEYDFSEGIPYVPEIPKNDSGEFVIDIDEDMQNMLSNMGFLDVDDYLKDFRKLNLTYKEINKPVSNAIWVEYLSWQILDQNTSSMKFMNLQLMSTKVLTSQHPEIISSDEEGEYIWFSEDYVMYLDGDY